MFVGLDRRDFLKVSGAGALGIGLCRNVWSQAATPITATKVAENYTLLAGGGSNVLVVHGPEGILMVDGGVAERSADLLKAVTGLSPEGRFKRCSTRIGTWSTPVQTRLSAKPARKLSLTRIQSCGWAPRSFPCGNTARFCRAQRKRVRTRLSTPPAK